MSTDLVQAAIETFVTDNWTACAIQWPNRNFKPVAQEHWMRVEFVGGDYDQTSIGSGSPALERYLEYGVIWFHIQAPIGVGETIAAGLGRQMMELFKMANPLNGNLEFQRMSLGGGMESENQGPWWEKSLSISYVRK